jgi:hypothetical protein
MVVRGRNPDLVGVHYEEGGLRPRVRPAMRAPKMGEAAAPGVPRFVP